MIVGICVNTAPQKTKQQAAQKTVRMRSSPKACVTTVKGLRLIFNRPVGFVSFGFMLGAARPSPSFSFAACSHGTSSMLISTLPSSDRFDASPPLEPFTETQLAFSGVCVSSPSSALSCAITLVLFFSAFFSFKLDAFRRCLMSFRKCGTCASLSECAS